MQYNFIHHVNVLYYICVWFLFKENRIPVEEQKGDKGNQTSHEVGCITGK